MAGGLNGLITNNSQQQYGFSDLLTSQEWIILMLEDRRLGSGEQQLATMMRAKHDTVVHDSAQMREAPTTMD